MIVSANETVVTPKGSIDNEEISGYLISAVIILLVL